MAQLGLYLILFGAGSFILNLIGMEFKLLMILDLLGPTTGIIIKLLLIIVGAGLIFAEAKINNARLTKSLDFSNEMAKAIAEESKLKNIDEWNIGYIETFIRDLFSMKLYLNWVREKQFTISENNEIYLKIYFTDKDKLIDKTQEITLKNGKKYTQKKHDLLINKEYSEQLFSFTDSITEDLFEKISKLNNLKIQLFLFDSGTNILDIEVSRDMYNQQKAKKLVDSKEKLNLYTAKYNFDAKNYEFSPIS
jgi:hypothetical protein